MQFTDENAVEAALLMNEKKFPPMLPRKLRVMRARKMQVKPSSTLASRVRANSGTSAVARAKGGRLGKPRVFEGHRATAPGTAKKGKPESLKRRKRERNRKRPDSNSGRRAAQFKSAKARARRSEGKS